jgi:hypothetical protein
MWETVNQGDEASHVFQVLAEEFGSWFVRPIPHPLADGDYAAHLREGNLEVLLKE